MNDTEKEILKLITLHYSGLKASIDSWYEGKHYILGGSPKELIKAGKALKVLEFLRMVKS